VTAPWVAHFGLSRTPFGKAIPARDLYSRQAHEEAVARINFRIVESALGVVTGDVGAGKTVSVRAAVSALDSTRHQVIYIANPAFGTRGLYVTMVRALGAQPRYLKAELMAQAQDLLAAEAAERHRKVVVVVDEAHLLEPDQLEELRLLTNGDMDSSSPFAGILVGQPTLSRQLRMGRFAALDQRIATRFAIKAMDIGESSAYLRHHLALAALRRRRHRPPAPGGERPAACAQQCRHRSLDGGSSFRQGLGRRCLRQAGRCRDHEGLTVTRSTRGPPWSKRVAASRTMIVAGA
jgi:type II secretory pathway predicted ATPase ExeA